MVCLFAPHRYLTVTTLQPQPMKTSNEYLLRYYDGELVRTIDDPEQVSRGAGLFIMSQGLFGGGWFVEGAIEDYEAEFGLPAEHRVDYIRYWKEK